MRYGITILLTMGLLFSAAHAIEINEVCSSNSTAYRDASGAYPDWIELYNPSDEEVDASDYWISNDADHPKMHRLSNLTIPPHGYYVLSADKKELPFKLSASGCAVTLVEDDGSERSIIEVPSLDSDETYSLQKDGTYHITEATAGAENARGSEYHETVPVAAPALSHTAGFYAEAFELTMQAYRDVRIYYTLDGSLPDESSTPYTQPVVIENASYTKNVYSALTDISTDPVTPPKTIVPKGTIVRAIAIDGNGNQSKVVTRAYFVGLSDSYLSKDIFIVSLVADPYDMFDSKDGIYMLGKRYDDWLNSDEFDPSITVALPANYTNRGDDSEIRADIQVFDANGDPVLNQAIGLRIHGSYSRNTPKKSFRLYARKKYDLQGKIDYRFWPDFAKADRLILRSGGNNQVLMFYDAFAHTLLSTRGLPYSRNFPCIAFINGEYWGLYNIRQYQDNTYISSQYGISEDEIILIKNNSLKDGEPSDERLYRDFMKRMASMTCYTDENLQAVAEWMDIDNYTQYLTGVLYIANTDWLNNNNNISLWRTRTVGAQSAADTRWRWIYQDLDATCGRGQSIIAAQSLLKDDVFMALWTNAAYRNQFLTCLMDTANFDCSMNRVSKILDEYAAYYRNFVEDNYLRYSADSKLSTFDAQVETIRAFFQNRPTEMVEQIRQVLNLNRSAYTLSVSTNASKDACIKVNGHDIDAASWSGMYFEECPILLEASDVPGKTFLGWYENGTVLTEDKMCTIEIGTGRAVRAVYRTMSVLLSMGENASCEPKGESIQINTGRWQYDASLTADSSILLTTDENKRMVSLTPDNHWDKGMGFKVRCDTGKYDQLSLLISFYYDAPETMEWDLLCGIDDTHYETFQRITLRSGENTFAVALPETLSDECAVYLWFQVRDSKKFSDSIDIHTMAVYGNKLDVSLANAKSWIRRCTQALGDRFEAPEITSLQAMTQTEVSRQIDGMRQMLANALASDAVSVDQIDSPCMEGIGGYASINITREIAQLVSSVEVPLENAAEGAARYRYALSDDRLQYIDTVYAKEGSVTLPAKEGLSILLEKPAEAYRYTISFSGDTLDASFVDEALYGISPAAYLWVDVNRITEYQDTMAFSAPSDGSFGSKMAWLYRVYKGNLFQEHSLSADADGVFTMEALPAGRYLLLPQALSAFQREAAHLRQSVTEESESTIQVESKRENRAIIYYTGAFLVCAGIIAAICMRKKHS